MDVFKHERQEAFQASLELVAALDRLTRGVSQNRTPASEQLTGLALIVVRETAAGLGLSGPDGQSSLRTALSSTLQVAGLLDVVRTLRLTDDDSIAVCRQIALRIAGLLEAHTGGKS